MELVRWGLGFVTTPFVLKCEHDIVFVRRLPVRSIVKDMSRAPELRYVRFSQRQVFPSVADCDRGYLQQSRKVAPQYYKPFRPLESTGIRNSFHGTICYTDMNHIAATSFLANLVQQPRRSTPLPFETEVQRRTEVALLQALRDDTNRSSSSLPGSFFIFGDVGMRPAIFHLDAARAFMPAPDRWCFTRGITSGPRKGMPEIHCRRLSSMVNAHAKLIGYTAW